MTARTEAWLSHHHAQPTAFDWAIPALRRLSQVRGKLGVWKVGAQSEDFDEFWCLPTAKPIYTAPINLSTSKHLTLLSLDIVRLADDGQSPRWARWAWPFFANWMKNPFLNLMMIIDAWICKLLWWLWLWEYIQYLNFGLHRSYQCSSFVWDITRACVQHMYS